MQPLRMKATVTWNQTILVLKRYLQDCCHVSSQQLCATDSLRTCKKNWISPHAAWNTETSFFKGSYQKLASKSCRRVSSQPHQEFPSNRIRNQDHTFLCLNHECWGVWNRNPQTPGVPLNKRTAYQTKPKKITEIKKILSDFCCVKTSYIPISVLQLSICAVLHHNLGRM